jgi:hypothetical protein
MNGDKTMTDLQEKAMRMALEALDCLPWQASPIAVEATKALRQALAQPVKSYCGGKPNYCTEPEDWVKQQEHEPKFGACVTCGALLEDQIIKQTPKREWVGLTDIEIEDIYEQEGCVDIVLLTEAKLKEKNGG